MTPGQRGWRAAAASPLGSLPGPPRLTTFCCACQPAWSACLHGLAPCLPAMPACLQCMLRCAVVQQGCIGSITCICGPRCCSSLCIRLRCPALDDQVQASQPPTNEEEDLRRALEMSMAEIAAGAGGSGGGNEGSSLGSGSDAGASGAGTGACGRVGLFCSTAMQHG